MSGDVHIHGPRDPVPDDSVWLRSCWDTVAPAGAAIEMRYLTRSDKPRLDAFLVVRTEAADPDEAEHRCAHLREQLGILPGHAVAAPVTDADETHRVLRPFEPPGDGIVEVRKRLTVQQSRRGDTAHPWLTAVTPLRHQRQAWDPLWTDLAQLPYRAMLSVGLLPYSVGPGLRAHLAARAADLTRLAQPGPAPTGVWNVAREPDEFAGAALALVSDAVRRYTDRAFLLRVSVAAERTVPGLLAERIADTISPRTAAPGFAGAAPAVVRPEPADLAVAWDNVTALNFAPLTAYAQGNPPAAIGELEQVLGAIADLDEAAAAFRLPYRPSGRPPVFAESP